MKRSLKATGLASVLLLGFAGAFVFGGEWGRVVTIRVKENRVAGLETTIPIPLAFFQAGLSVARLSRLSNGIIPLNTGGVDVDLRAAWAQIKQAGNLGPIPFEKDGLQYAVAIRQERLVVSVTRPGRPENDLCVQIAFRLVDAALSAGGNCIDLNRLVEAAKNFPLGMLLDIRHPDFQVEVSMGDLGF